MNDTVKINNLAVGDKVIVTRWYNSDGPLSTPVIATARNTRPDGEGDLIVRDEQGHVDRFAYRGCWKRIPNVGERVVARQVPGLPEHDGKTGVVANPAGREWEGLALQAGNVYGTRPRLYVELDDLGGQGALYVTEWDEIDEVPPTRTLLDAAVEAVGETMSDDTRRILTGLTPEGLAVEYARVADMRIRQFDRINELERVCRAYGDGLEAIGGVAAEQAEEQGWCEKYERMVEHISGVLRGLRVPVEAVERFERSASRGEEWAVNEVVVSYSADVEYDDGDGNTFTGTVNGTIKVDPEHTLDRCKDEDDAKKQAKEWAEGYFDRAEINESLPERVAAGYGADYCYEWDEATFRVSPAS